MGRSLTSIMFFTEDITLLPHTASEAKHIGRPVSIGEFAGANSCSLKIIEGTNPPEYVVETIDHQFMEGPLT